MIKISGPVSVGVFKLYKKHIFLLGDRHTIPKGLCRPCTIPKKCFSVTNFIDSLQNVDIFIEDGWLDADTKEVMKNAPSSSESVLHIVRSKYSYFLYGFQVQPNKRFHYGDIRFERTLWPLTELCLSHQTQPLHKINEDELVLQFRDAKYLKQFADILVKSDDYKKSITTLFPETIAQRLLSSNPVGSKKQTSKIHRIRKQILKLPKNIQQRLLVFHNDRCREIIKNYNTNGNEFYVIFDSILPMLTHLMDMYLLARLLHYIKKKDTKHVVTYTGTMHTNNYIMFFTKYMKEAKLVYHEDNTDAKRVKWCVTLPSSIQIPKS